MSITKYHIYISTSILNIVDINMCYKISHIGIKINKEYLILMNSSIYSLLGGII